MSQSGTDPELSEENKTLRLELASLREELEAAQKTITLQQECLFKGYKMEDFQKCPHCHKIFTNHSYLISHIERRHKASEGDEAARKNHKETQTENISESDLKTEDSTSVPIPSFKEENLATLKNRKSKNQLTKNFTLIGKKLNKILKKK